MPNVSCPAAIANTPDTNLQGGGTIVIPGRPFAKQRPRFSRKSGRAYTPAETVSFERNVGMIAARHFPQPLEGPVRVIVRAYFAMPASWSKKKRAELSDKPHTQRPDIDNLQKAVLDGLNRIAFADDAQIAELTATKYWSTSDVTFVEVMPL